MITRLDIKGYKSIRDQVVELAPVNVLIGGNGVGKSNFISLFSLVRNLYEQNLQNYVARKGGADAFLHRGSKQTQEIYLDFYFGDNVDNPYNRFIIDLVERGDTLLIEKTQTAFKPGDWHYQTFDRNVLESGFKNTARGQAYYVNDWLKEFEVFHFHDTGDLSPMKKKCNIEDNRKLKSDGSNLAAYLYLLQQKHPRQFKIIEMTIASIAPFFDGFMLEPSRLNEDMIELRWREKGMLDSYFNAGHLSDGTLRFIALATLLLQPEPPRIIIIDEPELGLHPFAISKLAALMRKASAKSQLIVSTQSVNFVDNFAPEDILTVDRVGGDSVFKRLDSERLQSWLEEYSLGELWEKNVIDGQPLLK